MFLLVRYLLGAAGLGLIAAAASAYSEDRPLRTHRKVGAEFYVSDELRETTDLMEDMNVINDEDTDFWRDLLRYSFSMSITSAPSAHPSVSPSASPSVSPTTKPSTSPSAPPSVSPSAFPSNSPTHIPSLSPSKTPTATPSFAPTNAPVTVCGVTPEERTAQIMAAALRVSNSEVFDNPNSPQSKALNWLIDEDALFVCQDDPKLVQRYVMAVFYWSTEGDSWTQCSAPEDLNDPVSIEKANEECDVDIEFGQGGTDAWLTPVYECNWGGVACQPEDNCVERIEFEENNLAGTLPQEIQELTDLKFFLLEKGSIGGALPPELGNLANLLELDLNFNEIEGSIPEEIYSLNNLIEFDVNDNKLDGIISTRIGQMSALSFLALHRNELTGTIPTEVGELDQLIAATFDSNKFIGAMAEEVCLLRGGKLRTLTSDCLDSESPFYVDCPSPSCCSQCF